MVLTLYSAKQCTKGGVPCVIRLCSVCAVCSTHSVGQKDVNTVGVLDIVKLCGVCIVHIAHSMSPPNRQKECVYNGCFL